MAFARCCLALLSVVSALLAVPSASSDATNKTESRKVEQCYSEEVWRNQGRPDLTGIFQRCGPELVCLKGHADCQQYCNVNEECEHFPLRFCDDKTKKCKHKDLFAGNPGPDIGAAILFSFISGLALSAGIGGGGLYVPLLMAITGFKVRPATALSQACLSGGACSALFYNMRQRHPSGRKPMIDYDLVLVMGPCLLTGALAGSALNAAMPGWLILGLLTIILVYSAFTAMQKAIKTWRKESAQKAQDTEQESRLSKNAIERLLRFFMPKDYAEFTGKSESSPSSQAGVAPKLVGAGMLNQSEVQVEVTDGGDKALVKEPTEDSVVSGSTADKMSAAPAIDPRQEVQFPKRRLAIFGTCWLFMVVSILVRGGRKTDGLVEFCSVEYWFLLLVTAAVLGCIGSFASYRAVAHANPPAEGEGLHWTPRVAAKISLVSLGAGTLAALCGIGGGMVMGPILLNLGFMPQVQAATTATTLFVMSTSTCLGFVVSGTAPVDYAIWLACATAVGAVFGKAIIGWLVKKFRRPSLLMFLLTGIIIISVILMLITGLVDLVNSIKQGEDMLFRSLCSSEEDD